MVRPSALELPDRFEDLCGRRVAFLARHGIGHHLTPSEVNYRANIYALKSLGVGRVVSVSACGSLREDYVPGHVVVPDQIFDHTHLRARSFFGDGIVGHVSVPDPFCPDLSSRLAKSVETAGGQVHEGASITIEGPRFSTGRVPHLPDLGMAIIRMTTSPKRFWLAKRDVLRRHGPSPITTSGMSPSRSP
jgi:5'-methylthioadenosine phosphorylase